MEPTLISIGVSLFIGGTGLFLTWRLQTKQGSYYDRQIIKSEFEIEDALAKQVNARMELLLKDWEIKDKASQMEIVKLELKVEGLQVRVLQLEHEIVVQKNLLTEGMATIEHRNQELGALRAVLANREEELRVMREKLAPKHPRQG